MASSEAHAAVVSHAPRRSLEQAQREVEPVWEEGEGIVPKAFGEEDVNAWRDGRLDTLTAWLRPRRS